MRIKKYESFVNEKKSNGLNEMVAPKLEDLNKDILIKGYPSGEVISISMSKFNELKEEGLIYTNDSVSEEDYTTKNDLGRQWLFKDFDAEDILSLISESRYEYNQNIGNLLKSKFNIKKTSDEGILMYVPKDSNSKEISGYYYDPEKSPIKGKAVINPQSDEMEKFLKDNNATCLSESMINEELGFKDILMGISLLASVVMGNTTTAEAKDKLSNSDVATKIEYVLNNKEQLNKVVDSLKANGMHDAAEVIQTNAKGVKEELKKIDKSLVNYSTVKDYKTLQTRLNSGWAISSVTMDTIVQTLTKHPEMAPKIVYDTINLRVMPSKMFAEGSFELDGQIKDTLSDILESFTSQGSKIVGVEIESSTDKQRVSPQKSAELKENGYEENNKGLSTARNEVVKEYLVQLFSDNGDSVPKMKQTILFEQGVGTVGAVDPQDPSARYVKIKLIAFHIEQTAETSPQKTDVVQTVVQSFKMVKPLPKITVKTVKKTNKVQFSPVKRFSVKNIAGCPASHF